MNDFEIDMPGILQILSGREASEELRTRANQAVGIAQATGPRGRHGRHVIDRITVGDTHIGPTGAVVDIDWPDSRWHLLEYGSVNNPPYRVVTNAAQQAGLTVIDERGGHV